MDAFRLPKRSWSDGTQRKIIVKLVLSIVYAEFLGIQDPKVWNQSFGSRNQTNFTISLVAFSFYISVSSNIQHSFLQHDQSILTRLLNFLPNVISHSTSFSQYTISDPVSEIIPQTFFTASISVELILYASFICHTRASLLHINVETFFFINLHVNKNKNVIWKNAHDFCITSSDCLFIRRARGQRTCALYFTLKLGAKFRFQVLIDNVEFWN